MTISKFKWKILFLNLLFNLKKESFKIKRNFFFHCHKVLLNKQKKCNFETIAVSSQNFNIIQLQNIIAMSFLETSPRSLFSKLVSNFFTFSFMYSKNNLQNQKPLQFNQDYFKRIMLNQRRLGYHFKKFNKIF